MKIILLGAGRYGRFKSYGDKVEFIVDNNQEIRWEKKV